MDNVDLPSIKHPLYKIVADSKSADASAWVFLDKYSTPTLIHFKMPKLGDEEVRVKVTYAGLCFSDVHFCRGAWGNILYPIAPGHEIVGHVTEVGKKVTAHKIGDLVCIGAQRDCCRKCKMCNINEVSYCNGISQKDFATYGMWWGGYSTHVQQPEKFAFKVPNGIPQEVCAPLLCAGITVWSPIARYAKPGMKTGVIGIGGLGHLALQYLSKLGIEVVGITSSIDKKDEILKFGANSVINSKDKKEMNQNRGKFDLLINCLSAAGDYGSYISLCAPFGVIAQCGAPDRNDKMFITNEIIGKGIKIVGMALGTIQEIEDMLQFSAKHKVFPQCEQFEYENLPKAFNHLEKGKPHFRCVVNVGKYSQKSASPKF